MAKHNAAAKMDDDQSAADLKIGESYKRSTVFKVRRPLELSPKRRYALAVISPLPLQKQDGCETVFADNLLSGLLLRILANRSHDVPHARPALTCFRPFSFDQRDAARKVEREQRLKELRQEQLRCPAFKANPVRRYKPLNQHPRCPRTGTHRQNDV